MWNIANKLFCLYCKAATQVHNILKFKLLFSINIYFIILSLIVESLLCRTRCKKSTCSYVQTLFNKEQKAHVAYKILSQSLQANSPLMPTCNKPFSKICTGKISHDTHSLHDNRPVKPFPWSI